MCVFKTKKEKEKKKQRKEKKKSSLIASNCLLMSKGWIKRDVESDVIENKEGKKNDNHSKN